MRIIGGKNRGRKLYAPPGDLVRPTADRAREALFDILAHGKFADGPAYADAQVLDAFAGTGAFGLEALSRGARFATFLEKDKTVRATLTENIAKLGETDQATVVAADALRPPRASGPCNLVFLDPPYGEDLVGPALIALSAAGWIADNALVIAEVGARRELAAPEGFAALDDRRYGAARLIILRHGTAIESVVPR